MTHGRSEQIAARAYAIWHREGRPEGQALRNWLQAERELSEAVDKKSPEETARESVVALEKSQWRESHTA